MIKRFSLEELERIYKDAWWSGVSVEIEDFLMPYLSDKEKSELREHLESWVSSKKKSLERVESETDLEAIWNEKIRPNIQHSQPPLHRPSDPGPIELISLVLTAHAVRYIRRDRSEMTGPPSEPNSWELMTADGDKNISLPSEIAQRCYSKPEQKVTLCLHRVPVANTDGIFEPQLNVSPPPTHNAMKLLLVFANGEKRALIVSVPRGRRDNAWSQWCEPLPEDAFGTENWEVRAEFDK